MDALESKLCVFQRLGDLPNYSECIPRVAHLVYNSGADYFDILFGSKEAALSQLSAWIARASSAFSFDRITVALIDDAIVGMILALSGKELADRQKTDTLHLIRQTGSSQREMILQKIEIIRAMTPAVKSDEFYLRSLSVDETHRGRGLGRALVKQFINAGLSEGFARFRLDVRGDNIPAISLYRGFGFNISEEFAVPQTEWKLYSMVFVNTSHEK